MVTAQTFYGFLMPRECSVPVFLSERMFWRHSQRLKQLGFSGYLIELKLGMVEYFVREFSGK